MKLHGKKIVNDISRIKIHLRDQESNYEAYKLILENGFNLLKSGEINENDSLLIKSVLNLAHTLMAGLYKSYNNQLLYLNEISDKKRKSFYVNINEKNVKLFVDKYKQGFDKLVIEKDLLILYEKHLFNADSFVLEEETELFRENLKKFMICFYFCANIYYQYFYFDKSTSSLSLFYGEHLFDSTFNVLLLLYIKVMGGHGGYDYPYGRLKTSYFILSSLFFKKRIKAFSDTLGLFKIEKESRIFLG